jgi:hypothetical protein
MDNLSGKTAYPFADKVFDFNSRTKTFQEIFGWMALKVKMLQGQLLQPDEVVAFGNACVLICKIIKQRPKYYHELNESYKQLTKDRGQ